jgi:hypothetical protein
MLHRKAGTKDLIEVHGSIRSSSCLSCHARYELDEVLVRLRSDVAQPSFAQRGVALVDKRLVADVAGLRDEDRAQARRERVELRAGFLVVGERVDEPRLRRDLELKAPPYSHRAAARPGPRRAAPVVHRPTGSCDRCAVRQPAHPAVRCRCPEPISAGAVGDIVAKHAAAGVREDRRTAHALRHTFCTMLAERDVALEVIRALAGHVDVRTTQIYVDVTGRRTADGIGALERIRRPLAA